MERAKKEKKTYRYLHDQTVTIKGKYQTISKHLRARTNDEWKRKLADLQHDADTPYGAGMTVREWSGTWLTKYKISEGITPASYALYPEKLNTYILPELGHKIISEVTPGDCDLGRVQAIGKSIDTQKKIKLVMSRMFEAAKRRGIIHANPADGLKFNKARPAVGKRAITPEEQAALLSVCRREIMDDGKPNNSAGMYLLMLFCGLRPGEVAALQRADLDWDNNLIHVHAAREAGRNTVKTPKTASGVRDVPMDANFAPWLHAWLERHPTRSDLLFTQRDGKTMLSKSSMDRRWETYRKYMDIELGAEWEWAYRGRKRYRKITKSKIAEDFVPYCLRHTYGSNLAKAGLDRFTIARIMGHSDPSTTEKYYLHFDREMLAAASARLSEYRAAHGGDVLMSDIARWGSSLENAQNTLELLFPALERATVLDPEGDDPATRQLLLQFQATLIGKTMLENQEIARKNCKKALGAFYNENHFLEYWNASYIYQTWPAKKYEKKTKYEIYLLATNCMPLDRLDGMTTAERERFVRGLVEQDRPFGDHE